MIFFLNFFLFPKEKKKVKTPLKEENTTHPGLIALRFFSLKNGLIKEREERGTKGDDLVRRKKIGEEKQIKKSTRRRRKKYQERTIQETQEGVTPAYLAAPLYRASRAGNTCAASSLGTRPVRYSTC